MIKPEKTNSYAVIQECGRQYKVEAGQEVDIDYRDAASGDQITFDTVLAVSGEGGTKIGTPTVAGASVTAQVLGPKLGTKIVVQKFKRRKNARRKMGHRQMFIRVRIGQIQSG